MVGFGHQRGRSESAEEISHVSPLRYGSASRIPPHSASRQSVGDLRHQRRTFAPSAVPSEVTSNTKRNKRAGPTRPASARLPGQTTRAPRQNLEHAPIAARG